MENVRPRHESSRKQTSHKKNPQDWTMKIRHFFFVLYPWFLQGFRASLTA
ncbi:hypothetical protein OIU84_029492 [Salix udensis]|uniref:Uncharacterized protein n=1 Tax=Salix udensis TaxID=889485 RepID=A0AAD6K9F3_9ROSI|nr:hypothetical protein OIU84_029492 [Salix udensis]